VRLAVDVANGDAPVPVSIGSLLPGIYRDDDPVAVAFAEALDNVLAPIWATLDCIDSYFDPRHAPRDFVQWLASWVGLPADGNWNTMTLRRLVLEAQDLFRWWGTREGLIALIEASEGVTPQIIESGSATVSAVPNGPAPPDPGPVVTFVVPGTRTEAETARLERLIRSAVPPHLAITVRAS
jgi:phage tail-like protein